MCRRKRGCQIFLGTIYQNGYSVTDDHKAYQIAIKESNRVQSSAIGHERFLKFSIQMPSKSCPNGEFGFKINHLATLV
jgi:hypothetical protein